MNVSIHARPAPEEKKGITPRLLPFLSATLLLLSRADLSADVTIGGRISGERSLSGRVRVAEDLVVLPGATLALAPGTVVEFAPSDSTKVDPEQFLGGTELSVRGRLEAAGALFRFPSRTGGIVVDGGQADLSGASVEGAETGVAVVRGGRVRADREVTVRDCRVGVALFPGEGSAWEGNAPVTIEGSETGLVRFPGAIPLPVALSVLRSGEVDRVEWEGGEGPAAGGPEPLPVPSAAAVHLPDTFLERDRTLSGDVVVEGVIRVAPGATLTILPGSRLFFAFRDTDGDGIGENGIFLQGTLRAAGTKDRPVGFYPLEGKGPGRWDAINFMVSEEGGNLVENAVIVGAYRGLHAHFSRLSARYVRIADCLRGIQFQESKVALSGVEIERCGSAIRCRDSNVTVEGLRTRDTLTGSNFFRTVLSLSDAEVVRPGWYGFRFRESRVRFQDGSVRQGYVGISAQEGEVDGERLTAADPGMAGFSWQGADVKISESFSKGSLVDALTAAGGKVLVTGGGLEGFRRYAVRLGGPSDVTLKGVDVGTARSGAGTAILDGTVEPGLGIVKVE